MALESIKRGAGVLFQEHLTKTAGDDRDTAVPSGGSNKQKKKGARVRDEEAQQHQRPSHARTRLAMRAIT